ncbi:M14 family metallocarboxypeptidase [bacterium]|nr:M14 family metallocarboxypeptidase [bacterium]
MARPSTGTLTPWGPEKKLRWFLNQKIQRSYHDDVLVRLKALRLEGFQTEQYGALTLDPEKFPVYALRVTAPSRSKPTVLITGGVHGYETSGVKGALQFLENHATDYAAHFNLVVFPCVSPWSYETVNRLDPIMENPNREFKAEGKAEESRLVMQYLAGLNQEFDGHIDLHETTDSDRVFLPEEYSKNGLALEAKDVDIPDGFYLIGQKGFVRAELEKSMLDSVRAVSHVAKANAQGMILDNPITTEGMIHIEIPGCSMGVTQAASRLGAYTTEMYPDSPRFQGMTQAQVEKLCSDTQVACVRGALDFWIKH